MLAQLSVRDIVLIDRLDLAFAPGLSVLTGETGAGKSILLDAFALALGGRGDGGLVRNGQSQGQVTAAFDVPSGHPARAAATAHGLEVDGDLILRRVQMADGRTRAFINDQPVSVQALRAVGRALVEIHGQHDDRALMDPASHRAILDAFGGHGALAAEVAAAARRLRDAREELEARIAAIEAARREADYLRHAVDELSRLAPEAGEEEQLAARRQAMMQAEKVVAELNEAHQTLSGHASPIPFIASAMRRLERRLDQAPHLLEPGVRALDAALNALEEAAGVLERSLADAEFDPRELETVEERLFALRGAARKHGVTPDELPQLLEKFQGELENLDAGEKHVEALGRAVAEAEAAYVAAARRLSQARREAAAALDAAVGAELPPLKLERARFITEIDADESARGPEGFDRVGFVVQTNPGSRPGPMMKVASGGELSRFMLALKVALADRGSAPTLVFDEIDTGVGGAVADAIGQRLARLARRVQVICVTHAPQVAARATHHFLIAKEPVAATGAIATRVTGLASDRRREEIARMLAGSTITEEARAAAARLLDGAA
ncbi:DNA repair protein RecN [Camelimonas abortus]|uniref:DNA repair protein RecN n=1 Tax=Camelimonas abortus TaxID=1017184 RepID=A0ABV7LEP2_9HYPH